MSDRTIGTAIVPRDRRFGRAGVQARWWLGGDAIATAVFNALSVSFPKGEAFFVDSVKRLRDRATPANQPAIAAFVQQEVLHSREHLAFNRRVHDHGYDFAALDARIDARLADAKTRPPIVNLAATMAFEHFTAIFAERLLADPRHLTGADAETAALWRWHAFDEIEHKAVAFDLFADATRGWWGARRWLLRCYVMLRVTWQFLTDRGRGAVGLLRQDGIGTRAALRGILAHILVRPGMLRQVMPAWAAYFRPGFHPWQRDDHALLRDFAGDRPAAAVAGIGG